MTHEEIIPVDPEIENLRNKGFFALSELRVGLEEIPEPVPCYTCNSLTNKDMIAYKYIGLEHEIDEPLVFRTLPGYICQNETCGVNFMDPRTDDLFLNALGSDLAQQGDTSLSTALKLRETPLSVYEFTTSPTDFKLSE